MIYFLFYLHLIELNIKQKYMSCMKHNNENDQKFISFNTKKSHYTNKKNKIDIKLYLSFKCCPNLIGTLKRFLLDDVDSHLIQ